MKQQSFYCFVFISLYLSFLSPKTGAQTKKITVERPNLGIVEKYYVLKSDTQTRIGKYTAYTSFGNRLICEGYYSQGVKDSLWQYYYFGNKIAEIGYYKNGKKAGIWVAYDENDHVQLKYNFTNQLLVFYKTAIRDSAKVFNVIKNNDTVKTLLDRPPIYLDGENRLSMEMITGLKYPAEALHNNITGKVIVVFTIDKKGKVSNYRIKNSVGYGIDEEALLAVERAHGDWLPGVLAGNAVTVDYEIPLNFKLGR